MVPQVPLFAPENKCMLGGLVEPAMSEQTVSCHMGHTPIEEPTFLQ